MIVSLALTIAAMTAPSPPPGCTKAAAFTGTICAPAAPGKHPAILMLGGSEGGDMMSYTAPQFAKMGYVAASVAYFGLPGLPKTLENIPVETVGKALGDIAKRSDVDPNRIAIFGISKGGEFALLAASTYPQIHAVIADVPSPFGWQGIPQGPEPQAQSSWTVGGKPVAFVPYAPEMGAAFGAAYAQHKPLDLRPGYVASMQQNANAIPAAMFHLERIDGPVFFLAAGDDQIWDSVSQSELGMKYLHDRKHPYADRYESYPGAGHIFLFSSSQRPLTSAPEGPITLLLGGSAAANVAAAQKAWPQIASFLSAALQARP